jgi:hypothetical protein
MLGRTLRNVNRTSSNFEARLLQLRVLRLGASKGICTLQIGGTRVAQAIAERLLRVQIENPRRTALLPKRKIIYH